MALFLGGLANGAIIALVAIGIVLSYRATGLVNFAHGELMMLSAYTYVLISDLTGSPVLQIVGALSAGAVGGLICFVLTGIVLAGFAEMTLVISTLGLLILFQSVMRHVFTDIPLRAEPWLFGDQRFSLLGVSLPANSIVILTSVPLVTVGLIYWQSATVFGRSVLAAAEDPWRAALCGIHVRATLATSWIVSGILAGLAGVLLGPVIGVFPGMGADIVFPAFIAAILGGFGSVAGAMIGGLLLGLLQTYTVVLLGGVMKETVMFGFLLLMLLWRPNGLFSIGIARRV